MSQFLLFYKGKGPKPQEDVAMVEGIRGVKVVAQPTARTVILEISNDVAVQRVRGLKQWALQTSQSLDLDPEPEGLFGSRVPGMRIVR